MLLTSVVALGEEKLPKGAQQVSPGVHKFVDKDGKTWIYRQTPFGLAKTAENGGDKAAIPQDAQRSRMTPFGETKAAAALAETAGAQPPAGTTAVVTKVVEDGDSVRFERPSPFGVYKWTRKKTELTADEQKLWDDSRASSGGAQKTK